MAKMKVRVKQAKDSKESIVKILLVVALIVLLGFSLLYIYNMHTSAKKLEQFNEKDAPKFTVVYIYSKTCPYCVEFTPIFEKFMTSSNLNNVVFEKFEKNDEKASEFMNKVKGFPTVLVLDNAKNVIDEGVGKMDFQNLANFVKRATSNA